MDHWGFSGDFLTCIENQEIVRIAIGTTFCGEAAGLWLQIPCLRMADNPLRDHRKLRAFELAGQLALEIYRATEIFPKQEVFGLTSQLRRAAVSIASNIVEGCARASEADYLRFLDMAYGSAREVEYQLSLAFRLGYLSQES
jgi:four helix bundle protein